MTCAQYNSPAPMCACGNEITKFFKSGKPGKFCAACRDKQTGALSKAVKRECCAQCGATELPLTTAGKKAKYCSASCKWRAQTLRRNPDSGTRRTNVDRTCTCNGCGKQYENKRRRTDGEGSSYCSRECAFADKAKAESSYIYAGYCLCCGKPFVSRRARSFCSLACHPVREYVSIAPAMRTCTTCGISFAAPKAKTRPSDFCGAECKAAALSKQRRVSHSRRRAITRTAKVESVDPFKVFERDKWRCQLCGTKTPKTKRGTYDPTAPELDHIITLAEGGEHSYRNTQCACRKCNGAKSSRSKGQLLMF